MQAGPSGRESHRVENPVGLHQLNQGTVPESGMEVVDGRGSRARRQRTAWRVTGATADGGFEARLPAQQRGTVLRSEARLFELTDDESQLREKVGEACVGGRPSGPCQQRTRPPPLCPRQYASRSTGLHREADPHRCQILGLYRGVHSQLGGAEGRLVPTQHSHARS
jgi:hypothetical protein